MLNPNSGYKKIVQKLKTRYKVSGRENLHITFGFASPSSLWKIWWLI
jgi:hypothetical protein